VLGVRPVILAETSTGLLPAFLFCFFGSHPRALVGKTGGARGLHASRRWRGVCCSEAR
jgi:hypothetical protein